MHDCCDCLESKSASVVPGCAVCTTCFVSCARLQSEQEMPGDWQKLFGSPQGPIHSTFAHMLGNLSLITGLDNRVLSNKPFEEKLVLME